jgi:gliding motility-associated-like protein
VATDQFGCVSDTAKITISTTKPIAGFAGDTVVCKNETLVATDTSTGVQPVTNQWFLNNNPAGNSNEYTTALVPNAGQTGTTYNLTLIATDVNGCKDTVTKNVTVSTPLIDMDYEFSGAVTNDEGQFTCPPVFTNFTNLSSSYGIVSNFQWIFGDGKSSSLENPSNIYVFPGIYSMSFKITDEFGCQDSTGQANYLTILGPTAKPIWEQNLFERCGQVVDFQLTEQEDVFFIEWHFGDGTSASNSTPIAHEYTTSGEFAPSVTITDDKNCSVIYPMDTLQIISVGLLADFSADPTEAEIGQEITLTDLSTTLNTSIIKWAWYIGSFGDIINSTGESVPIGYGVPGVYTITLIVQDDKGCYDTHTETVRINNNFTMPNIFTPNGDGINDFFALDFGIFESYNFFVLNRWGNIIKNSIKATGLILWDGKADNGHDCTEGVYFYKFIGNLGNNMGTIEREGFISLER